MLRAADIATLTIACLLIFPTCRKSAAQASSPTTAGVSTPATGPIELQLEVFVNGVSSQLIATFRQTPDATLLIEPDQLRNVGIKPVKQALRKDGWIDTSLLPGVSVTYDEAKQAAHFDTDDSGRAPRVIDAQADDDALGEQAAEPVTESSFGALVNYTVFGATGGYRWSDLTQFQGLSGQLEGRVFGPYGLLSSSQVLRSSNADGFGSTRLDTRWSYSDPDNLMTYNVGDIITGGLSWTRPTRLGGIQIRRNFTLRPDIVTMPLPELSGSAAVPSTVDIYIDNARRVSRSIPAGPFAVTNLPVITGNGMARMVVRDALGRETVSETPFYASADLLAKGLADFSGEVGFARRFYGTESNDYDGNIVGTATVRYGFSDKLTLEGHVEAAGNFYSVGTGSAFSIGSFGIGTVAAATSQYGGETGYQLAASIEADLWDARVFMRTQRTFGDYNDIASITADLTRHGLPPAIYSAKPAKALDQISVSLPPIFEKTNLNFSHARVETAEANKSNTLSASISRSIGENGNMFVSAYTDLERKRSFGVFAGLSWTLGDNKSISTSVSANEKATGVTTELMKSEQAEVGGTGWRLRGSAGQNTIAAARGSYRSQIGRVEAGIEKLNGVRADAQFEGAIVATGGGVFLSNRIDDAFGVVDVGAPDVEVQFENRPMGKTDSRGKMLLPDLRAYEKNTITIDPTNLPIDATVGTTRQVVSPADRAGVVAGFNVKTDAKTALVTLRDNEGQYIEAGSTVELNGAGDFIVGYDGQVYLEGIARTNRLRVRRSSLSNCEATFAAPANKGGRIMIPDAVCRSVP